MNEIDGQDEEICYFDNVKILAFLEMSDY